jgi:hypothetical protein
MRWTSGRMPWRSGSPEPAERFLYEEVDTAGARNGAKDDTA